MTVQPSAADRDDLPVAAHAFDPSFGPDIGERTVCFACGNGRDHELHRGHLPLDELPAV